MLLAASLVLTAGAAGAAPGVPERFPGTAGTPTTVIAGTHYLDAATVLGRFGLESSWVEPQKLARFTSAWTRLEFEADKREITYNGLRLFMGDAAVLRHGRLQVSRLDFEKLIIPLLRPAVYHASARPPRVIAIDAGHGGRDTGTRNERLGMEEKTCALDVARRLAALLEREGYSVVMTRADDRYVALAERAEAATRAGADLFVSIHFNAAPARVRGVETYVLTPQHQRSTGQAEAGEQDRQSAPGNVADPWNTILGLQIHRSLLDRLDSFDRGLKRARFAVLRLVSCPAVLIEAGYLSNEEEARRIATESHRDAIAEGIANGIAAYRVQVAAAGDRNRTAARHGRSMSAREAARNPAGIGETAVASKREERL